MVSLSPRGSPAEVVAQLRGWLNGPDEVRLVVETSGSTGRPKRVVLPRRAVLASVHATESRLGASGQWVLALPPTFVAGVLGICRSLVAGHEPLLSTVSTVSTSSTGSTEGRRWPTDGVWFTSLVPTQLRRSLESPDEVAALRTAHTVLIGGGSIGPTLLRHAEDAGVRVVATYGSAETAGGCVYDGRPLDGVGVAIGRDGRIRVTGPTIFEKYDDDPDLSARTLVDGWFLTSDAGRLDEDGRLQVLGRLDDMVVSGGVNVPAPAVAARLREHPAVRAVEVLGVPDEEWGAKLVAFVVAGDAGVDLESVRDWVAEVHPRPWAPRALVVLDEIPMLVNGKPDRAVLRGLA